MKAQTMSSEYDVHKYDQDPDYWRKWSSGLLSAINLLLFRFSDKLQYDFCE